MPYLKPDDKQDIDKKGGEDLYRNFSKMDIKDFAGALNYINFRIVKEWIKINKQKYFCFATIIGTLVCCILEIYRRLIVNYEETKKKINGDV